MGSEFRFTIRHTGDRIDVKTLSQIVRGFQRTLESIEDSLTMKPTGIRWGVKRIEQLPGEVVVTLMVVEPE